MSRYAIGIGGFARMLTLAAVSAGAVMLAPLAFAADSVPYDDPSAQGDITLCDRDLKPITQGSIDDLPFVWRAVGSQAAPPPYNDENRQATLFYVQPRKGVAPGDWTPTQMAGNSTYTNPDHPIGQSTVLDFPLKVYTKDFPPLWNGFIQLRLVYTTVGQGPAPVYATADLKVTGDTWRVVNPGNSPCDAGDAVSAEVAAIPNFEKSAKAAERKIAKQEAKTSGGADPSASAAASEPTGGATSPADPAAASDSQSSDSTNGSSSSQIPVIVMGILVLGAVVAGAVFWLSRRA